MEIKVHPLQSQDLDMNLEVCFFFLFSGKFHWLFGVFFDEQRHKTINDVKFQAWGNEIFQFRPLVNPGGSPPRGSGRFVIGTDCSCFGLGLVIYFFFNSSVLASF